MKDNSDAVYLFQTFQQYLYDRGIMLFWTHLIALVCYRLIFGKKKKIDIEEQNRTWIHAGMVSNAVRTCSPPM